MTRFCGPVGYGLNEETVPGVYIPTIVERKYYGDILRNTRRYEQGSAVNGNIKVNNSISIVADAYAYQNFFAILYVEWNGVKWTVTNVEVQRPRLVLTIGEVYNG